MGKGIKLASYMSTYKTYQHACNTGKCIMQLTKVGSFIVVVVHTNSFQHGLILMGIREVTVNDCESENNQLIIQTISYAVNKSLVNFSIVCLTAI